MLATAAASLSGLPVLLPGRVRYAAFVILGLQIGGSFTWDSLSSIAQWPVSLIVLTVNVAVLVMCGYLLFTKVFRWDAKTAFFASKPGALAMTLAMAEHYGADIRRVAAAQSLRLFFLVALLPMLALRLNGQVLPASAGAQIADPLAIVLILSSGTLAGYVFHLLGAPAGFLLGAMLANAILQLCGLVSGRMPDLLLIPAFVILGIMVGSRFRYVGATMLRKDLMAGVAGFAVAIVVATSAALLASQLTGLPLMATMLAFAPGGLEVMTILAFALGVNPAFVATHQLARYVGINLSLPFVSQLFVKRADE